MLKLKEEDYCKIDLFICRLLQRLRSPITRTRIYEDEKTLTITTSGIRWQNRNVNHFDEEILQILEFIEKNISQIKIDCEKSDIEKRIYNVCEKLIELGIKKYESVDFCFTNRYDNVANCELSPNTSRYKLRRILKNLQIEYKNRFQEKENLSKEINNKILSISKELNFEC